MDRRASHRATGPWPRSYRLAPTGQEIVKRLLGDAVQGSLLAGTYVYCVYSALTNQVAYLFRSDFQSAGNVGRSHDRGELVGSLPSSFGFRPVAFVCVKGIWDTIHHKSAPAKPNHTSVILLNSGSILRFKPARIEKHPELSDVVQPTYIVLNRLYQPCHVP